MAIVYKIFLLFLFQQGVNMFKGNSNTNISSTWQSAAMTPVKNIALKVEGDYSSMQEVINICMIEDRTCEIKSGNNMVTIIFKKLDNSGRNRIMNYCRFSFEKINVQWVEL